MLNPVMVSCDSCGTSSQTTDYANPDRAVACECCSQDHDHAGLGCRPITITVGTNVTLFH